MIMTPKARPLNDATGAATTQPQDERRQPPIGPFNSSRSWISQVLIICCAIGIYFIVSYFQKSSTTLETMSAPPPIPPRPPRVPPPIPPRISRRTKRGISVPWNFPAEHFNLYTPAFTSRKISWVSNWEMWRPVGFPDHIPSVEYIPQIRTAENADQIPGYLKNYANEGKLSAFMGFNEPDIADQANMLVDKAVDLWTTHVLPTKHQLCNQDHKPFKLGSPAISNGPQGLPWLADFIGRLGGTPDAAGIDVVVIHYYSPNVEHFKQYVTQVHRQFGKPVWVTEFACTTWDPNRPSTEAEVLAFMREALRFLDTADFVERYAWFGAMEDVGEGVGRANGLQKPGGTELSEAGKVYTTF